MKDNVDKVLDRGERLEDLQEKSGNSGCIIPVNSRLVCMNIFIISMAPCAKNLNFLSGHNFFQSPGILLRMY